MEETDTLVVGGGQAGIAMSAHLRANGIAHVVLERDRIAERWRTGRWDALVANGPAWHDRFPGLEFAGMDPDAYATKDAVVAYFEAYARMIDAPIRCGITVKAVQPKSRSTGFDVQTSAGPMTARNIVAATGPFQTQILPDMIPERDGLLQVHSGAYRNPDQLPAGAVLVVGSGSSGVQIADELLRAGRRVFLSVGPHDRPPRAYRGRDYCWWLGVLGKWDATKVEPGKEHVTIAVSGARGGHTIDFRDLAARGMILTGRTMGYADGKVTFADDLARNIAAGDANYLSVLNEADAFNDRYGLGLPPEPQAHVFGPTPHCVTQPLAELDLAAEGVTNVLWGTGYGVDYSWLKANALDARGQPVHERGITPEPGVYFLGLPWQSRRGSSFIWGVWHDAKFIADHIITRRHYADHHAST